MSAGRSQKANLAAVACLVAASAVLYRFVLFKPTDINLDVCKKNIHSIAVACQNYSIDNSGRYPKGLESLTPGYLPNPLTCPNSGDRYQFESMIQPDQFTVQCKTASHPGSDITQLRYSYHFDLKYTR